MIESIHKHSLVPDNYYWYIFEGQRNQRIVLLLVQYNLDDGKFWTYESESNNKDYFKTFPIDIPLVDDEYQWLYQFDNKEQAELQTVYRIVSNFNIITGMDFETFISRYKELLNEYPELLLKA